MSMTKEEVILVRDACISIKDALEKLHQVDCLITQKVACGLLCDVAEMVSNETAKRMAP